MNATTPKQIRITKNLLIVLLMAVACLVVLTYLRHTWQVERDASAWTELITGLQETNTGLIRIKSGETRISYASREANNIFGYSDLEGLDITELMPSTMDVLKHNLRVLESMDNARMGHIERPVVAITCVGQRRDGSEINLVIRIFIGKRVVLGLFNLAEETRYLPLVPLESPEPQAAEKK